MANKVPYYLSLAFYIISFVLCIIAYGTGHWYEGGGEDNNFKRLGLWEACFNGYEHTSDYIGKAYYGCWWIFHKEYWYIRDWIMPSWFIAIQTLMTFAVVLGFITIGLLGAVVPCQDSEKELCVLKTTSATTLLTTLCLGVVCVVFGTMVGEDRTWMPRWDEDYLGWSFGLAVVAGFLAAFSTISIIIYTLIVDYEQSVEKSVEKGSDPRGHAIPMKPTAAKGSYA